MLEQIILVHKTSLTIDHLCKYFSFILDRKKTAKISWNVIKPEVAPIHQKNEDEFLTEKKPLEK